MLNLAFAVSDDVKGFVRQIVDAEGGYVNDPDDRGGPTKYGITLRTLSHYLGRVATQLDVETLDIDTAEQIYVSEYYVLPHVYALPDALQHVVTDMCVNHGAPNAVRILQTAVNSFSFELAPLNVDGAIGPATVAACTSVIASDGAAALVNTVCDKREVFVRNIAKYNPSQEKFLGGWICRIDSFRTGEQLAANQMLAPAAPRKAYPGAWVACYAWRPVRTGDGEWVWLERVRRRAVLTASGLKHEYEPLDNPGKDAAGC